MATKSRIDAFFEGTISETELITLVNELFTAPDFYESCWDEFDVLFQRIVWEYPDGHLLTFAPKEGLVFSHIKNQITAEINSELETLFNGLKLASKFDKEVNGFRLTRLDGEDLTPDDMVLLVNSAAAAHGAPVLNLPWEDRAGSAADEAEEFLEDEDADEQLKESYAFFARFYELDGNLPALPWGACLNTSDALMPEYSSWGRFYRLLSVLEEDKKWIVINGECCGTCAGGSIRSIKEEQPELADAPTLVVYEQNAEGKWGALGWVAHYLYLEKPESLVLEALAKELGLRVTWDGEKETGFFVLS